MLKFKQMGLALLLATLSASSWAYQPLITDDTGTQGEAENQLEISFSDDRIKQGGVAQSLRMLPLTYTRGLSETLDISIGVSRNYLSSDAPGAESISGNSNPSLGLKWRFYDNEASKTSLAVKGELGLPINREQEGLGLGSGKGYYIVTAILMQETSFGAVLFNLAGAQVLYTDTVANPNINLVRASIAPVWQVNEQWKLALDMGGTRESTVEKKINIRFLEIGAVYSPSKDLDLAFGFIGRSASEGATSKGLTVGMSWRFR